ncbi:MAG: DNA-directed RNA polymerase subunit beta [Holosporales bacterium]|jgi:DNA-directed RNA polymerase subunit beta|nr:DNA-directed RNA polymerase subunit beta [Holosporales bacterium]
MARSYTGRKRIRRFFGKINEKAELPDLIALQKNSFDTFLQYGIPPREMQNTGLLAAFNSFFPVRDPEGKSQLEFCEYTFEEPKYTEAECRQRGGTYSASLRGKFRLVVWDVDFTTGSRTIKDIKEQDVYLGDIPLMTDRGTFIFNGVERVVVSQMHRSPGVFIDHDHGKSHSSGKYLFAARIIPYRGSWIDFEFDYRDVLYVRIDRRRKVLASTFLMCLESSETEQYRKKLKKGETLPEVYLTGMSKEEILNTFHEAVEYKKVKGGWSYPFNKKHFGGTTLEKDIIDAATMKVVAKAGDRLTIRMLDILETNGLKNVFVPESDMINRYIAKDTINEETGEVYFEAGENITDLTLKKFEALNTKKIDILFVDVATSGPYMLNTFAHSRCNNRADALLELYRALVPGEVPSVSGGEDLLYNILHDPERYDLSAVGRAKINDRLGIDTPDEVRTLQKDDLIKIVKMLFAVKDGKEDADDIDNLGNRRVRSVGELIENQCRIGMLRMERTIREKVITADIDNYVPSDLINAKPLVSAIRDFFLLSQLSQFMDQTNPLSEVTHKRRLSALGPGGLSRERAGFEVRDVHPTHYSRLCPIETPEGQNIGLINSLASYAKINRYGFIEAPYRKVVGGKITNDVIYLTATEEWKCTIAQAGVTVNEDGDIVDDLVISRRMGDIGLRPRSEISYADVSPRQAVSVAAALIPFLENDDASRALMGANMQRQAVPLVIPEAPLVGTGMEEVVARDSGAAIVAKRGGIVDYVDAKRIVIRVTDEENAGADVYTLSKFVCSNMGTCINQKPIVKPGDIIDSGDVIADGPSTENGELALGRNLLVAFMSWRGYSFEDSIILSENVVRDDVLTSIHIESFEVTARDTKLGNEEFTRDIPNIAEESLRNLDESGIVYIGSEVKPGDILVGKVTPKGETPMTPEEKLLRAIFGEKAADVKGTSFKVPPGVSGTVVDVQVLMRRGVEKDERAIAIEMQSIDELARDRDAERKILEQTYHRQICSKVIGQKLAAKFMDYDEGTTIKESMVEGLSLYQLMRISVKGAKAQQFISNMVKQFEDKIERLQNSFNDSVSKLRKGDDLPAGVLKIVKVFVANKRKIQPGDKMAGRHGNKGVVSKIVPVEDMPYLADGTPVDIVLNPLGLPSRMNVGQILETHLGAAAHGLGIQIQKALDEYRANAATLGDVRDKVVSIYCDKEDVDDIKELNDDELVELAENLSKGIPVASPVFDGAKLADIEHNLERAGLDKSGQGTLYDGCTGEPFDRPVTVGYKYMLKLHHLVDDKIHARSVGPYSLITQQPLGGKAQFGGQRFGEMEVWALEGYGASHILREMLTVKSDDVRGRTAVYESIVSGESEVVPQTPESFNVLVKELNSLGLSMSFEHSEDSLKESV